MLKFVSVLLPVLVLSFVARADEAVTMNVKGETYICTKDGSGSATGNKCECAIGGSESGGFYWSLYKQGVQENTQYGPTLSTVELAEQACHAKSVATEDCYK